MNFRRHMVWEIKNKISRNEIETKKTYQILTIISTQKKKTLK